MMKVEFNIGLDLPSLDALSPDQAAAFTNFLSDEIRKSFAAAMPKAFGVTAVILTNEASARMRRDSSHKLVISATIESGSDLASQLSGGGSEFTALVKNAAIDALNNAIAALEAYDKSTVGLVPTISTANLGDIVVTATELRPNSSNNENESAAAYNTVLVVLIVSGLTFVALSIWYLKAGVSSKERMKVVPEGNLKSKVTEGEKRGLRPSRNSIPKFKVKGKSPFEGVKAPAIAKRLSDDVPIRASGPFAQFGRRPTVDKDPFTLPDPMDPFAKLHGAFQAPVGLRTDADPFVRKSGAPSAGISPPGIGRFRGVAMPSTRREQISPFALSEGLQDDDNVDDIADERVFSMTQGDNSQTKSLLDVDRNNIAGSISPTSPTRHNFDSPPPISAESKAAMANTTLANMPQAGPSGSLLTITKPAGPKVSNTVRTAMDISGIKDSKANKEPSKGIDRRAKAFLPPPTIGGDRIMPGGEISAARSARVQAEAEIETLSEAQAAVASMSPEEKSSHSKALETKLRSAQLRLKLAANREAAAKNRFGGAASTNRAGSMGMPGVSTDTAKSVALGRQQGFAKLPTPSSQLAPSGVEQLRRTSPSFDVVSGERRVAPPPPPPQGMLFQQRPNGSAQLPPAKLSLMSKHSKPPVFKGVSNPTTSNNFDDNLVASEIPIRQNLSLQATGSPVPPVFPIKAAATLPTSSMSRVQGSVANPFIDDPKSEAKNAVGIQTSKRPLPPTVLPSSLNNVSGSKELVAAVPAAPTINIPRPGGMDPFVTHQPPKSVDALRSLSGFNRSRPGSGKVIQYKLWDPTDDNETIKPLPRAKSDRTNPLPLPEAIRHSSNGSTEQLGESNQGEESLVMASDKPVLPKPPSQSHLHLPSDIVKHDPLDKSPDTSRRGSAVLPTITARSEPGLLRGKRDSSGSESNDIK